MTCLCPLCEGDCVVVWDDGIPRRFQPDDPMIATECPACNGTGIEPSSEVIGEEPKR